MFFLFGALLSLQVAVAAPLGLLPKVDEGKPRIEIEYLTDLWTSNQNKEDDLRFSEVRFKFPFSQFDLWKISLGMHAESFSAGRPDLTVGKEPVRVGPDLRSLGAGLGVSKQDWDGSWFNYFGSYNSASDEPFSDSRDAWGEHTLVYAFAPEGSRQWYLGFNQSHNRGYLNGVPIPVFGALYRPYSDLAILVGVPFLHFELNIQKYLVTKLTMTPVGLAGELSYQARDDLSVRWRAGVASWSFLHSQRTEPESRLFVEQKYFDFSFRRALSETTSFGLALGYSFDRRIYEAEQIYRGVGGITKIKPDITGGFVMDFHL